MRYFLLITTMLFTLSLSAQRGGERVKRGDKIEQQRVVYITTQLDLSVEESQTFWPIYNEYQNAKKEIETERRSEKKIDELTEDEARLMLSTAIEAKRKRLDLEVEFMNNLEQVLPVKKRLKLVKVEREFKRFVLNRYKKRMKRGLIEEEERK